jgi:hypothetical protein
MKKIYSLALLSSFIFSSCAKLDPESKLTGTWKLDDVVKRRFFNNDHLTTGYEAGLFKFYENGTASYTDTLTMSGNWNMHYEDRGYYDGNGDYHYQNNLVLRIKLVNFSANRFIDWEFDDTKFKRSSDRLDGFIYSASSSYQYSFRRQ